MWMKRSSRLAFGVAASLLGCATIVALVGSRRGGLRQDRNEQVAEPDVEAPARADLAADDGLEAAVLPEGTARQASRRAFVAQGGIALGGKCLDVRNDPVAGAEVSWGSLMAPASSGSENDTRSILSDADGRFAFGAGWLDGASRSVIWATHPAFVAGYSVIVAEESSAGPQLLVLEPAPTRLVTVTLDGKRVIDAAVEQRGQADEMGSERDLALRALERKYSTGPDGTVAISTLPGDELLLARRADMVSLPQTGPSRGDVELALRPTFVAEGTAYLDEPTFPLGCRVSVASSDSSERVLGEADVPEDGAWGPIRVPLSGAAAFEFTLSGGGIIPQTLVLDSPEAGARVRVDFDAKMGIGVRFRVLNQAEEPLAGALAIVHWLDDGEWVKSESPPSGEDGVAIVPGCPAASIYFDVRCVGFANTRSGPFLITSPDDARWTIRLERAARLVGRCIRGGEPVPSFKILYWPTAKSEALRRLVVDDPDGSFELADVAPGSLNLVAASTSLGQSGVQQVSLRAGETSEVVVELGETAEGAGRIIDGATKQGIGGVEVQAYVSGFSALDALGDPVASDDEGVFRIGGFGDSPMFFRVSAEGYSGYWGSAASTAGQEVDLGVISLWPKQPLTVRLIGDEGGASRYSIETRGDGLLPTAFPEDGVLRIEEFSNGSYVFFVTFPDGSAHEYAQTLRPGTPWEFDVDATATRRLTVRVVEGNGQVLPKQLWAVVEPRDKPALRVSRSFSGADEVTISKLPPGPFVLSLLDDANTRAMEVGTFEGDVLDLTMQVELAAPRTFRVVDREEEPVPAASLWFEVTDGSGRGQFADVDAKGEAVVYGLPRNGVAVQIRHPTLGVEAKMAIDLPADPEEVVILELRAEGSIDIAMMDGETPAVGINCDLFVDGFTTGQHWSEQTDESGRVRWERLGEGRYRVVATHPDYWPLEDRVEPQEEARVLQIRRRGDLEISIDSSSGRVDGLAVQLASMEFGVDVVEWVGAGLVEASSSVLETDAEGRLVIEGLPHGAYQWRVITADGSAEGWTEVLPGVRQVERLLVP